MVLGGIAPAGWTDVRDAEGGYQVFLPGAVTKGQPQLAGPVPAGVQMTLYAGTGPASCGCPFVSVPGRNTW